MVDGNSLNLLGVSGDFDEYIGMQIVVVIGHVFLKVTQHIQDVNTLFKSLRRQMRRDDINGILILG